MTTPLVDVEGLFKVFGRRSPWSRRTPPVLRDVGFQLYDGEFVGLVGESGSGKTTLGRCLLGLLKLDGGTVRVADFDVDRLGRRRRAFTRVAQMVFQNPYASLDPAFRVQSILAEAVRVHGTQGADVVGAVARLADQVRLPRERLCDYPGSLSGGERRRVAFARALATRPRFVVADEPVSGIDPPIQVQLLDLLRRIHSERLVTFLLISHDLRVVRSLATRVLVLYRGRLVEDAPATAFFGGGALHPYSRELLGSACDAPRLVEGEGAEIRRPNPGGTGCPYRHRCFEIADRLENRCATMVPSMAVTGPAHRVACHRWRGTMEAGR